MESELMPIMMFVPLIVLLMLGVPLAFSLGIVAVIFGYITLGTSIFTVFASRTYGLMTNYVMVAVPLFILMGYLLEASGMAERLYNGLRNLFGPVRGGLAIGTVVVCTLFAASTGIIGASVVTMGLLAVPSMLKYKYSKDLATGTTCAAGTLGILIPPSIMLVVYGSLSGLSVGKLFAASIFPGLLLASVYIIYIIIRSAVRPQDAPAMSKEELEGISLKKRLLKAITGVAPVLILIICVLGSIFVGIATPTEAGAIGAFITLVLMVLYKEFTWKKFKKVLLNTLKTSCMVNLIVILAGCFTSIFMASGGGAVVTNLLLNSGFSSGVILFVILFIVFILGMFLDWIGILLIVVPIFSPIAMGLGYDPLWFAMLICVCLQMSFITPPFAYAIFYLKGVAPKEVRISDIYKGVLPYIALQWLVLYLCIKFPQIILWLPNKLIR